MVLPLKTQVLYGSLVGLGVNPHLTLGVAVGDGVWDGRVVDPVCSAPGLVTGFPDDMTFGVGELARGAEVVGVVVENLRGTCRPFGRLGRVFLSRAAMRFCSGSTLLVQISGCCCCRFARSGSGVLMVSGSSGVRRVWT